jgi:hypothetical protein
VTTSDWVLLNSCAVYSIISAANNMADIRGACFTMPAFVVVLFSYLCPSGVIEIRRT